MNDPYLYPKLRWPLDLSLHQIGKEDILLIRDPLLIGEKELALKAAAGPLLSTFTGTESVLEIAARYKEQGVTERVIRELVKLLDDHLLLQTPKFFREEQATYQKFLNGTSREAALAGRVYPADPAALKAELAGYFSDSQIKKSTQSGAQVGLAAPHIDYRRGKEGYAAGYVNFKSSEDTTVLLVGPSHQPHRGDFHLTLKDCKTPLGDIPCDREFVQELAAFYGENSYAEEILHRTEHSLELQLPFIRYCAPPGGSDHMKVAPILLGSFQQHVLRGREPKGEEGYEKFMLGAVKASSSLIARKRRLMVVAGVDMSHVGAEFGDSFQLTDTRMEAVRNRDLAYLNLILNQDRKGLFEHIAEDGNARRICGFSSMYTLIDLFDRLSVRYKAELFDYRQAVDREKGCAVTFAAIGFYL